MTVAALSGKSRKKTPLINAKKMLDRKDICASFLMIVGASILGVTVVRMATAIKERARNNFPRLSDCNGRDNGVVPFG